jgi:adenosine deaminase
VKNVMISPDYPLIDLHRHLDGSIRLQTILDVGRQYHLPLPAWQVETLRPFVQVTVPQPGVMAFIEKFRWMVGILVNYDVCRRVAYENVVDAQAQGIDYVELRFSPWFMAEPFHLDPAGVVEAVVDGVESAVKETGLPAQIIGILSRTYGPENARQELDALLRMRDHIVALDLAGDEANFPGELFIAHYQIAKENGWKITVHAGESAGAQSIWQALTELGADRIGHAVHALEDVALLDTLAERKIGVECNLTSNVQTSTVKDYPSHPIKRFLEHGILATINTDDPGISGIDLAYEYNVAAPAVGLSPAQICQAQINALQVSFLSSEAKKALIARKIQL